MFDWLLPKCAKCGKTSNEANLGKVDGQIYCEVCIPIILFGREAAPIIAKNSGGVTSWNELVTPRTFEDYIGQETIKKELQTMMAATGKHGIPVQHVLFSGSFGLGKTTIARIFANQVGDNEIITAVNIRSYEDFPHHQVVIVDEIHTIRDEEWLLGIMDRGNQTILGATTTAGSLSGPLRSRFVSLVLAPYSVEELKKMIIGAAKNLKYECPEYVAENVAQRGKSVARIALFLFKRVYDRVVLNNDNVTPALLAEWFEEMKIDSDGLDNADRAYISCLNDKPIGLQNLSAMTGLDRITLEETIEPYLLTKGFVKRTPRGRILGDKQALGVWA